MQCRFSARVWQFLYSDDLPKGIKLTMSKVIIPKVHCRRSPPGTFLSWIPSLFKEDVRSEIVKALLSFFIPAAGVSRVRPVSVQYVRRCIFLQQDLSGKVSHVTRGPTRDRPYLPVAHSVAASLPLPVKYVRMDSSRALGVWTGKFKRRSGLISFHDG